MNQKHIPFSKLAVASALAAFTGSQFIDPGFRFYHGAKPKEKTKYDLEALRKAEEKRERKAKK